MTTQRDLSHIKSLKDLQSEILNLKASIAVHETQLKERVKRAPDEAKKMAVSKIVPSALMKIIPFVLTRGAVASSFGFLKNAAGLLSVFKKQKGVTVTDRVFNTVKKAGAAAAIKGVFNFIKNRKHSNEKIEVL